MSVMDIKTGHDYLRKVPVDTRSKQAAKIRANYPNRVPVIVLQNSNDPSLPMLDKYKYLVPCDLTIGQFMHVLRKRLKIGPEKALFVFANRGDTLHPAVMMELVYSEHSSKDDGFLYITLAGENTFGQKE